MIRIGAKVVAHQGAEEETEKEKIGEEMSERHTTRFRRTLQWKRL
jgi:hypothetical protein